MKTERKGAAGRYKTKRRKEGTARCDACGWEPPPELRFLRRQYITHMIHVHHVVPIAAGGEDHEFNMILLCPNCHATAHAISQFYEAYIESHGWLGIGGSGSLCDALQAIRKNPAKWVDEELERRRELPPAYVRRTLKEIEGKIHSELASKLAGREIERERAILSQASAQLKWPGA